MSNYQRENLLPVLVSRSQRNIEAGGDGFITADSLRFDVGLSTQAIRRYLDAAVANGKVEHRQPAAGRRHGYKPAGTLCS